MTTNKTNKTHAVEDDIIALNGQIAERKRAELRLQDAKKPKGREDLTPGEDETLEECEARLAKRTDAEKAEAMVKALGYSLRGTVSNFMRRRKRHGGELLAKSLRGDHRLVIRTGKQSAEKKVTPALFFKAVNAFNDGRINGDEFNTIDLHMRHGINIPFNLLNKIS